MNIFNNDEELQIAIKISGKIFIMESAHIIGAQISSHAHVEKIILDPSIPGNPQPPDNEVTYVTRSDYTMRLDLRGYSVTVVDADSAEPNGSGVYYVGEVRAISNEQAKLLTSGE